MISQSDSFPLSAAELDSFNKNGFIGPFKVYDPEEMQERWRRIRLQLLDRSRAAYDVDALSGVTNIANYDRHLDNELLAEHICRNEIVDRVQSILGPNVLCWRSEFFPKYPGDEGTDWHQADTFANACGKPQIVWPQNNKFGGTITAWTAFTTSSKETGCLQFVPGTHESMNYDETKQMHYDPSRINQTLKDGVQRGFFGYDYRQLQIDPEWQPDESLASSFEMKAGEVILFWSTLMHASHPHLGETADPRIGFATRYVPSSVKIYPDTEEIEEYGGRVSLEKFGAVVVRGVHEDNGNKIAERTLNDTPFLTGTNND